MKSYDVYFIIFNKRMKKTVFVESITEAKQQIINEIKWHKVVETPQKSDIDKSFEDLFSDILGAKIK